MMADQWPSTVGLGERGKGKRGKEANGSNGAKKTQCRAETFVALLWLGTIKAKMSEKRHRSSVVYP